jgi:hypothetical protein
VDKFEPVSGGCDVNHGQEAFRGLVVPCGDSAIDHEATDKALDPVVLFVEFWVVPDFPATV